jgi:hypothetical protein
MTDPAQGRRPIPWEPWLIFGLILVAAAAVTSPLWVPSLVWRNRLRQADLENRAELSRRREQYEAIVQKISSLNIKHEFGHRIYFETSADRDPTTLRRCDDLNPPECDALWKQGRLIEVSHVDGVLKIRFITADFGFRGVFSIRYCSTLSAQSQVGSDDNASVTQIEPHWQAYYVRNPRDR